MSDPWLKVGDFWNDPRRWDGVDPHKECFWMVRRPDVIDVRAKRVAPVPDATAQSQLSGLQNAAAYGPYNQSLGAGRYYASPMHGMPSIINLGGIFGG